MSKSYNRLLTKDHVNKKTLERYLVSAERKTPQSDFHTVKISFEGEAEIDTVREMKIGVTIARDLYKKC
jgi:hypothetical protein